MVGIAIAEEAASKLAFTERYVLNPAVSMSWKMSNPDALGNRR